MSFTRFHDDPNRIQKTNLETSAINDYIFNVPNNVNSKSVFFNDPHITMQKNGNTLCNNLINVDSELKRLDRRLCKDNKNKNNYLTSQSIKSYIIPKNIDKTITNESRSTHPAWMYRINSTLRTDFLYENPQENVFIPFDTNLDTNILEKDYYNINNKCK